MSSLSQGLGSVGGFLPTIIKVSCLTYLNA
jgi:hypothetical protein